MLLEQGKFTIAVYTMPEEEKLSSFAALQETIARLRGPDGCPWDRQQTHASLRPYLLEECYEFLQAIEEGTPQEVCGELGDILLQVMLHAQIAAENGQFDIADVIRGLNNKLIGRHPHVFGGLKVESAAEVELNWEALKQKERREGEFLLDGVPGQMPALAYSQSVQRRAATVGFDWEKPEDIVEKLAEEVDEIRQAPTHDEQVKEFGDLLFTLGNITRRLDIDLEAALRGANERFYRRFCYMEDACRQQGISLSSLSFDDKNALWEEAKTGTV